MSSTCTQADNDRGPTPQPPTLQRKAAHDPRVSTGAETFRREKALKIGAVEWMHVSYTVKRRDDYRRAQILTLTES